MSNFQPQYNANVASITPVDRFASDYPVKSLAIKVSTGQGKLTEGTLLGKVTLGAVTASAIATKGALTPDATTPLLAGAQLGAYKAVCITATANAGTFEVFDPKGNSLGLHIVAGTAFANQIKFAIADAAVDFVVGDAFTITVAAGSGEYVKSLAASVDGSQAPLVVLAEDIDATSAAVTTSSFQTGDFISSFLKLGAGHTVASVREGLRARGIFISEPNLG